MKDGRPANFLREKFDDVFRNEQQTFGGEEGFTTQPTSDYNEWEIRDMQDYENELIDFKLVKSVPPQNTQTRNTQSLNTQGPKIPKAKYPRLKQRYQLNN